MTICGTEFDDPCLSDRAGRDYSEFDAGKRTKVRVYWLSTWDREKSGGIARRRVPVTITNRGAVTFDGRSPKEAEDREKIKSVFDILDGRRTL